MKSLLALLVLIFMAQPLYAAPFLVCDPYPTTAEQPTDFKIAYGLVTITVPAETLTDGSKRLHWDLGPLSPGLYNLNVTAVKVDPVWGTTESSPAPFSFTRPAAGIIQGPVNIKVVK